jgi:hypothetical protein
VATFALSVLRARAQQESDNVNSSFVATSGTVPEWTALINASYQELYGLLVQAFGNDYYVASPYSFTTDGSNYLYALPTNPAMFKLLGVDLQVQASSLWVSLKPFVFNDRNRFGLVNSPVPMAGQTVRLWYVPVLTALSGDSDVTVDIPNGWEEFIVIDAAMKALDKEESDVSVKMARKQAIIDRINAEAENRDAGSPAHIVDFYGAAAPAMQYHISGSNIWLIGGNTPAVPYGGGYFEAWGW